MSRATRVGVDVGGTFTDVVLVEEAPARFWSPRWRPCRPILRKAASTRSTRRSPLSRSTRRSSSSRVHGTTIATNTIIEGKGAQGRL